MNNRLQFLRGTRRLVACALVLLNWPLAVAATTVTGRDEPAAIVIDHRQSAHTRLRPVPLDAVQWTNGFWADRYRQLTKVTLDESWRLLADPDAGHVLDNFRFAAQPGGGTHQGKTWQDEWLYKWIEAAACVWRQTRDPALDRRMDEAIALIAAAQQPDGYLSTKPIAMRLPRLTNPNDHEVYNMGHLLTAGVIHHRMTGKDTLLPVARRTADFLCTNLGVTFKPYMAHNPSAIMGLVELHRLTGERKYFDCAQRIVDERGREPRKGPIQPGSPGTDDIQDRVPVRKSTAVVGHNVFFTYLYTGAGDISGETGEPALTDALQRLWSDLTTRKMFLHGGVSAVQNGLSNQALVHEAAGPAYFLPNGTCYNETCGQIGTFMWGYRMLALQPDAAVADIMEREMYNGFLPSLSLDGKNWFYRSVLRRYDEHYQTSGMNDMTVRRPPGRDHICCPSNLLRTFAQLGAYVYSLDDAGLWLHHYGGNTLSCRLLSGEALALEQITEYPWSGDVRLIVRAAPTTPLAIRLRVPGWAGRAEFALNGRALATPPALTKGYAAITRTWQAGDSLTLTFPMDAQLITADPRVEETRNQVAVMRGPLLYCVESPDLPAGMDVAAVAMPDDARFTATLGLAKSGDELGRHVFSLRTQALHRPDPRSGPLYRPASREPFQPFDLTLVPYFAWANRGPSTMSVFVPVVWKR